MALQNNSGHYLKIDRVDVSLSMAYCSIYRDLATRQSPTEFDKAVEVVYDISSKLADEGSSYVSTGNLFDDIKSVGYAALKSEPPFNGASGETWTDC